MILIIAMIRLVARQAGSQPDRGCRDEGNGEGESEDSFILTKVTINHSRPPVLAVAQIQPRC